MPSGRRGGYHVAIVSEKGPAKGKPAGKKPARKKLAGKKRSPDPPSPKRRRRATELLFDSADLPDLARRDFSDAGSYGEVPEEWDRVGGSVVGNEPPVVIDVATGMEVDPGKIRRPCPGSYFVAYSQETPNQQPDCKGTVWRVLVRRAERRALRAVRRIAKACRSPKQGEGCEVAFTLVFEIWLCTRIIPEGVPDPGGPLDTANVQVLFRVECFTL